MIVGGIRFELRDTQEHRVVPNSDLPCTSVIYLKVWSSTSYDETSQLTPPSVQSIPLTFRAMFHQYFQLAARIRKHYLSPRVLLCLLTGKFVPPINRKNLYRLQYSMLPARRAGIMEMWAAVNSLARNEKIPVINGKLRHSGQFGLTRSRGYGGGH